MLIELKHVQFGLLFLHHFTPTHPCTEIVLTPAVFSDIDLDTEDNLSRTAVCAALLQSTLHIKHSAPKSTVHHVCNKII